MIGSPPERGCGGVERAWHDRLNARQAGVCGRFRSTATAMRRDRGGRVGSRSCDPVSRIFWFRSGI